VEQVDAATADRELIQLRLDQPLEEIVQRVLRAALDLERGNRAREARRLGISLRTVQRYLAQASHVPARRGDA